MKLESDNSTNESNFVIERGTDSNIIGNYNATTVGANVTSYQATGLTSGTTYYFRVRATNAAGNSPNTPTVSATTAAAAQSTRLTGLPFGTGGSWGNSGNTFDKAFDGSIWSFFDAPSGDGDYVGLDLGSARTISTIRFAPRSGYASRMIGGKFQGSNTSSTSGFVDLYTIGSQPTDSAYTSI